MRDSWADYYRTSYCLAKLRQGAWATIADFTSDPAPSPSHAPLRGFAPALFYVYSETSTPRNHAPAPHPHGSAMSKLVSDFFDGVRAFLDGTDETPNTSVCHESSCLHSFRLWVDLLSVFLAPSSHLPPHNQPTKCLNRSNMPTQSRALSPHYRTEGTLHVPQGCHQPLSTSRRLPGLRDQQTHENAPLKRHAPKH